MLGMMKDQFSDRAETDGSKVTMEELVENVFERMEREWRERGTFEQPYIDSDGKVREILDVIQRPQPDQNNYMSTGPSRAGKTASTIRGLAQAYVVSRMTPEERRDFFERTTAMMGKEEAEEYIRTTEENAFRISEAIERMRAKGLILFNVDINKLKAKGAVWVDKNIKILAEKLMEPVLKLAREGYKVVLFLDEIQRAEDGSQTSGRISLRDNIKPYAEAHPNITLAIATTIEELAETIARDPATLNRYYTIFHDAASPEKVVRILMLKPYVKGHYGVESLDADAVKAIYLLGQRVHAKPSALTATEQYFNDILQEAQRRGVTHITLDFVFDYYDRNNAGSVGPRGILTAENIEAVFEYEAEEIRLENERDRARLRIVEQEVGGSKRITPPWWEAGRKAAAQVCEQPAPARAMTEGAETMSVPEEMPRQKTAEVRWVMPAAAALFGMAKSDPAIESMLDGLSEPEMRAVFEQIAKDWEALSDGERRGILADDLLQEKPMFAVGPRVFSLRWVKDRLSALRKGMLEKGEGAARPKEEKERRDKAEEKKGETPGPDHTRGRVK